MGRPIIDNMTSRSGAVANQFTIRTERGEIFQSYQSLCAGKIYRLRNSEEHTKVTLKAIKENPFWEGVVLGPDWDYSKTTGKYRNQFLDENKKATEEKIRQGVYLIVDDIEPFFFEKG